MLGVFTYFFIFIIYFDPFVNNLQNHLKNFLSGHLLNNGVLSSFKNKVEANIWEIYQTFAGTPIPCIVRSWNGLKNCGFNKLCNISRLKRLMMWL